MVLRGTSQHCVRTEAQLDLRLSFVDTYEETSLQAAIVSWTLALPVAVPALEPHYMKRSHKQWAEYQQPETGRNMLLVETQQSRQADHVPLWPAINHTRRGGDSRGQAGVTGAGAYNITRVGAGGHAEAEECDLRASSTGASEHQYSYTGSDRTECLPNQYQAYRNSVDTHIQRVGVPRLCKRNDVLRDARVVNVAPRAIAAACVALVVHAIGESVRVALQAGETEPSRGAKGTRTKNGNNSPPTDSHSPGNPMGLNTRTMHKWLGKNRMVK